jgi:hypothetical protein
MATLQGEQISDPKFSNPGAILYGPGINVAYNSANLRGKRKI